MAASHRRLEMFGVGTVGCLIWKHMLPGCSPSPGRLGHPDQWNLFPVLADLASTGSRIARGKGNAQRWATPELRIRGLPRICSGTTRLYSALLFPGGATWNRRATTDSGNSQLLP